MRYSLVLKTIEGKELIVKIDDQNSKYNLYEIDLFTANFENFDELVSFLNKNKNLNSQIISACIRYRYKDNDKLKNYSNDGFKRLDIIYSNNTIANITNQVYNKSRLGDYQIDLNDDTIKFIYHRFIEKIKNKNDLLEILESNYINRYIKDYIIRYMIGDMNIDEIANKVQEQLKNYKNIRGIYLWLNVDLTNSNELGIKSR